MDLTVLLGPPNSGKLTRSIRTFQEIASTTGAAFFLVPTTVDRERVAKETLNIIGKSLVGGEVGTAQQLFDRIAGTPTVQRTDRTKEWIIVRDALQRVPEFNVATSWVGFIETARFWVGQLRIARIWQGEELERVESELPGASVEAWHELERQVGKLLDDRGLRDDAWFAQRAFDKLQREKPGISGLVAYGFREFGPGQQLLLEQIARHVPVAVSLVWQPGRTIHSITDDLVERWRRKGAALVSVRADSSHYHVSSTLRWLGEELYEPYPSLKPNDGNVNASDPVSFVDCCGQNQEIEEIVRAVASLRANGYKWDQIAVVSAERTGSEQIKTSLNREGIPALIQQPRLAITLPACRAIFELLEAIINQDPIKLVSAFRYPVFATNRSSADNTELRLRQARNDGLRVVDASCVPASPASWAVKSLISAAQNGQNVITPIREIFCELKPVSNGELDLLRGVFGIIEGLVEAADGDESAITLRDIRESLSRFVLPATDRSQSGSVVIASPAELACTTFPALVLYGMHASAFRTKSNALSVEARSVRESLYLAVTRARETLWVIRQAAGADGGHLSPSPAWLELRRLFREVPVVSRGLGQIVVAPEQVRLESEQAASVAIARTQGWTVAGVDAGLDRKLESFKRKPRHSLTTRTGIKPFGISGTVSATELETYATCSARWFIKHILKDQDPDDDRTRRKEGVFLHSLLQQLAPAVRLEQLDSDSAMARANLIADNVQKLTQSSGSLHPSHAQRLIHDALALLEAEKNWQLPDTIDTECSIGTDIPSSISPGLVVGDVEVIGRVDRIDSFGTQSILHDYKLSSSARPASKLLEDNNLQLLIYWLALIQHDARPRPVAAVYRAVSARGSVSGILTDELKDLGVIGPRKATFDDVEKDNLLTTASAVVLKLVEDLTAGFVKPLPSANDCPAYCALQSICRVGEG